MAPVTNGRTMLLCCIICWLMTLSSVQGLNIPSTIQRNSTSISSTTVPSSQRPSVTPTTASPTKSVHSTKTKDSKASATTKFTYTGGSFPTKCAKPPPSSNYWFRDAIFGIHRTNSCQYEYCRADYASSFPAESDWENLVRTTVGRFATSSINTWTSLGANGSMIVGTSKYYYRPDSPSTKTLSREAAWWGKLGKEPCCDHCHVTAGTIDLLYWPPSTSGQNATVTITSDKFAYTSPSIYIVFNTIWAENGCSTIGEDHSGKTISFAPQDVSKVVKEAMVTSGPLSDSFKTYPMDWDSFYSQDCRGKEPATNKNGNLDENRPYDDCYPRMALPTGFFTDIDPNWGDCLTNRLYYGFYDPPFAFQPATGDFILTPPSEPQHLTTQNMMLTKPVNAAPSHVTQKNKIKTHEIPSPAFNPATLHDPAPTSSNEATKGSESNNQGHEEKGDNQDVTHDSRPKHKPANSASTKPDPVENGHDTPDSPTDRKSDHINGASSSSDQKEDSKHYSGSGVSDPSSGDSDHSQVHQSADDNGHEGHTDQQGQEQYVPGQSGDGSSDPGNDSSNSSDGNTPYQSDVDPADTTEDDVTHHTMISRPEIYESAQWSALSPTIDHKGHVVVAGHTMTADHGEITISGTPVVVATDHAVYMGNTLIGKLPAPSTTEAKQTDSHANTAHTALTTASDYSVDKSGNVVVGTYALEMNGASATISGSVYHVDSNGKLYVGTSVLATIGSAVSSSSSSPDIGDVIMDFLGAQPSTAKTDSASATETGQGTYDASAPEESSQGGSTVSANGGTADASASTDGTTETTADATDAVATGAASIQTVPAWLYATATVLMMKMMI